MAEREVAVALMRAGWSVFVPLFEPHGRVDLVGLHPNGSSKRIQVKAARPTRDGSVICFRTCSNTANNPVSYAGEIDLFGVWCPELDRAFLVPVDEVPTRLCHLRLTPAANGQHSGVRLASEYELRSVT